MDGVKELLPKVSGSDPTFEFEFCITNMEDITKMATEGGDHAQVVHLLRTADVSRYPFILDIFFAYFTWTVYAYSRVQYLI